MKNENENKHALREQAESWGDKDAVCWWYGQSYDGRQNGDKKARRKTSQNEGRDKAEKSKSRLQRGGGFLLNLFVFAWGFEVIRCDIAWYMAIYRDIISHTMRYHKMRYIEISYPYPELWD